jgi:hypothetical protein
MAIAAIGCMAFRVERSQNDEGQTETKLSPIYWFSAPDQNQMKNKLIESVCIAAGVSNSLSPENVTDEMLKEYMEMNKIEVHNIYGEF